MYEFPKYNSQLHFENIVFGKPVSFSTFQFQQKEFDLAKVTS